jgi:glutaminyl-peptide cyclotransferase
MTMRRILLPAALALAAGLGCAETPMAQTSSTRQAGQIPAFEGGRAWEHLRRQVAFGPRPAGSAALNDTRQYIIRVLKDAGLAAQQQIFIARTPLGEMSMANVVATIPGRRKERLVIGSHFDTKRADFRFVGANDSASSTAVLLELARVLAGRQHEFTIELLFLDGEEAVNWDWGPTGVDNTYGSRHYVETAQKAGTLATLKAFILLDMVGDRDLMLRRDVKSTPWLVDSIWATAASLGHGRVFSNEMTEVEDDHVPFLRAGIPAVDVIDLDYAPWHTAQDDLDHVSERSLQIVGDVIVAALPAIARRLLQP